MSNFLKLATNFASGLSAGGGDTTWRTTNQPVLLTVRVSDTSTSATATLPAGTVLLETWVKPDPDAIPTAGTVSMTAVDAAGNSVVYLNAEAATAHAKASISPIGVLDSENTINVASASFSTGGICDVGLMVILPDAKP